MKTINITLALLIWLASAVAPRLAFGESDSPLLREALRAAPSRHDQETPEQREQRRRSIVSAIESATEDPRMRALLLSVSIEETHLAPFVDDDGEKCKRGPYCDAGRAWSVWQLHGQDRRGTREYAARRASELLRAGWSSCGTLEGAIARYATGHSCTWQDAPKRAKLARELAARLGVTL